MLTFNLLYYIGACIVALGEKMAALYSPDDALRHGIEAAAKRTDEGMYIAPTCHHLVHYVIIFTLLSRLLLIDRHYSSTFSVDID